MSDVSAKDVKALRDATGAGMMDCKKALIETGGDFDSAAQLLREKGLAKAGDRSDRENNEGVIAVATSGGVAAMVQLRCETDFSAKSEGFVTLAKELADLVLAGGPDATASKADAIDDLRLSIKENIALGRVERIEAAPGHTIDAYLHMQDGRGVNGVIVEGSDIDPETLHQISLHIAFAKPSYLSRDEVPDSDRAKERESLLAITKAEGKPEAAWEKIVDGRLNGWLAERVLLEQGLLGDKTTVKQTVGSGSIVRFVQAYVGS